MAGRDHLGAWEARFLEQLIEGEMSQIREKEEKASEASPELSGSEVQLAHIGNRRCFGVNALGAFLIPAAREPRKALLLDDQRDSGRAQLVAFVRQCPADVVNGKILFAQGNDVLADAIHFWSCLWSLGGREKELPVGVVSKLMAQYTKAAGGIAEAFRRFDGRESFDEKSAQSFILPMGGIGGFKEGPC